jgi:hypothetical protein
MDRFHLSLAAPTNCVYLVPTTRRFLTAAPREGRQFRNHRVPRRPRLVNIKNDVYEPSNDGSRSDYDDDDVVPFSTRIARY